ncbi:MAG: galactokinase [Bacteroidota bacterium]
MTLTNLQQEFAHLLLDRPIWIKAPGRINLIGEHTDYNHGFVFPAAIDNQIAFGISKHDQEGVASIHSANLTDKVDFSLGHLDLEERGWVKYLQALLQVWMEKGYPTEGFRMVFGGNIPIGAGLSSSAAMGTGLLFGLGHMHGIELDRWDIAKMAQAAEHKIGANVGIMDQFAVLFGKMDKAMVLDCRDHTFEYFPIHLPDHELVLINTKVSHSLAESAYNDRRAACESVLAWFKEKDSSISTLRDISSEMLAANRSSIDPIKFKRVWNVLQENRRVFEASDSLKANDLNRLGKLLYEAHEGLSKDYEVSCKELDILVDLAKKEEAVLGARMMGGGFGGCTLNLMKKSGADAAIQRIMASYEETTQLKPEVYRVKIGEGVHLAE